MVKINKKSLLNFFAQREQTAGTSVGNLANKNSTDFMPASVLVPIIDDTELMVLFTQRTAHLKHHAGQISFPGGKMEDQDSSLEAAALRETREEIGLMRDKIAILGALDCVLSTAGFCVTPIVGLITPPLQLSLDPFEVESTFMAPLSFVLDPHNQQQQLYKQGEKQREITVINYGEHRIWGMTAAILVMLTKNLGVD